MKELRNLIYNELGFSKEEFTSLIRDEVSKVIKTEVTKVLNDENRLKRLIEQEIIRQVKFGELKHERRSFIISTMDAVYNEIDSVIHQEVLKRLKISLVEPSPEGETYGKDNRF